LIAAVEMINRPPFFEQFAASIRHVDGVGGSELIYKFRFVAKPRWLRWLLEPVMRVALRHETHKRLGALAAFLTTDESSPGGRGGGGESSPGDSFAPSP
jgi:hypothetical protein